MTLIYTPALLSGVTEPRPPSPPLLWQLFNSTRNEGLKATIASTMSRLLRFNPSLVSYTMDKFGVRLILSGAAFFPLPPTPTAGRGRRYPHPLSPEAKRAS